MNRCFVEELRDFIAEIKALDYWIKIDTNGSFHKKLKNLVNDGLIDYVAMDINNSLEKYALKAVNENIIVADIEESIDFLLEGNIDYEFRTTVFKELHTIEDIEAIAKRISCTSKYFLQNFVDSGDLISTDMHAHTLETLKEIQTVANKHVDNVIIREI